MPRTLQDIIEHADELAARAAAIEPVGDGHVVAVAALRAAVVASARADERVATEVAAARADGMSWLAIGIVLGTSGEAARKRFSRGVAKP
jgi:hypothetical protein